VKKNLVKLPSKINKENWKELAELLTLGVPAEQQAFLTCLSYRTVRRRLMPIKGKYQKPKPVNLRKSESNNHLIVETYRNEPLSEQEENQ